MYCFKCGAQVNPNLTFCNSCGTKLREDEFGEEANGKVSPLNGAITSLTLVGLGGFAIFVGLMAILLNNDVQKNLVFAVAAAYLGALFGVCYLLIQQISKLVDFSIESKRQERQPSMQQQQPAQPAYIAPPTNNLLEQAREPVMSITEHTTKSLEETPVERTPQL